MLRQWNPDLRLLRRLIESSIKFSLFGAVKELGKLPFNFVLVCGLAHVVSVVELCSGTFAEFHLGWWHGLLHPLTFGLGRYISTGVDLESICSLACVLLDISLDLYLDGGLFLWLGILWRLQFVHCPLGFDNRSGSSILNLDLLLLIDDASQDLSGLPEFLFGKEDFPCAEVIVTDSEPLRLQLCCLFLRYVVDLISVPLKFGITLFFLQRRVGTFGVGDVSVGYHDLISLIFLVA